MISVIEAKNIIKEKVQALQPRKLAIENAAFLTLAENIVAFDDVPAFAQSAMDGYAFNFNDFLTQNTLLVEEEMAAGDNKNIVLKRGQAVRIFTGAALPENADTVVIQEKISLVKNALVIKDEMLKCGSNVRLRGSEIKADEIAMRSGASLTPSAIGFLASIGIDEIMAFPKPSVHIIVTGKELKKPGEKLLHGQVYEANSFSLQAALQQVYIRNVHIHFAEDNLAILQKELATALQDADLVILTGGVSVGDYDFVLEATRNCGVEQHFHKLKQKPGKPLFFGTKGQIPVFGLPGNPSSVLTCFYEYVLLALEKMSQQKEFIRSTKKILTNSIEKKAGLTHFLKGLYKDDKVATLGAQESYRLSSFAQANCLICLEEEKSVFEKGEVVEVHIIH